MVSKQSLFASLPPEWPEDLLPAIQRIRRATGSALVALDDDPTGTQTVAGVPVLTGWSVDTLAQELSSGAPVFYILTNSRSLPLRAAQALNREIGENLLKASDRAERDFTLLSRSDSTLRGHFPGELYALQDALGLAFDGWIIAPFFEEGGRFTVNDVHYVAQGDELVPAGETEFARDRAFGYAASNLRAWVEEKSGGAIPAAKVKSISIEELRLGGPLALTERLKTLEPGSVIIANAAAYRDLEVLALGLLQAEAAGKNYLYRSAASLVRVLGGLEPRALLTQADLDLPAAGTGLVVAGSYVPRTSRQLEVLFQKTNVRPVELRVRRLLDPATRADEIVNTEQALNQALSQGEDTVLYTSRDLVTVEGTEANLEVGRAVSDGLIAVIQGIAVRPRYIVAKGGITSSDVATRGLAIRRAVVLGQLLPGVPVWKMGEESRYPGLVYVVFPGNVGGEDALARVVELLG